MIPIVNWLTHEEKQMLFSSICLAFSNALSVNCNEIKYWRLVHKCLKVHENSKSHVSSANAYIKERAEKNIEHVFYKELL